MNKKCQQQKKQFKALFSLHNQNNEELMDKKYQQQKQQFNSLIRRGLYSQGRPEFLMQIGQLCVYCVFDLCPVAFQTLCGLSRAKVEENFFAQSTFSWLSLFLPAAARIVELF